MCMWQQQVCESWREERYRDHVSLYVAFGRQRGNVKSCRLRHGVLSDESLPEHTKNKAAGVLHVMCNQKLLRTCPAGMFHLAVSTRTHWSKNTHRRLWLWLADREGAVHRRELCIPAH